MWPEKVQAERYQRQRGLWRQGSFCISEGAASKGFTWAADGDSWAKYENVAADCPAPCTLSLRYRSSPNTSFPPQVCPPSAPPRPFLCLRAISTLLSAGVVCGLRCVRERVVSRSFPPAAAAERVGAAAAGAGGGCAAGERGGGGDRVRAVGLCFPLP